MKPGGVIWNDLTNWVKSSPVKLCVAAYALCASTTVDPDYGSTVVLLQMLAQNNFNINARSIAINCHTLQKSSLRATMHLLHPGQHDFDP